MRPCVALVLTFVPLLPEPRAQEVVWRRTGTAGQELLGGAMAVIGDVNGDGIADVITVIQPYGTEMEVLSGRDGSVLRHRPQFGPTHGFQTLAAAGDVDGDGIGDYATTLVDGTGFDVARVQVCSGRDDHEIYQVTHWAPFQFDGFGAYLAGDLDLDGDGRPDLVISAIYDRPRGAVYAYLRGGTRQHLIREADYSLGPCARVGDVDHDGCDDFVVGAGHLDTLGRARVYSGRTGALLVQGFGEMPNDNLGDAVMGCGDLDGDGVPDFAAAGLPFQVGRLITRAFSGRTGQALYTWPNKCAFQFAEPIDFDQDGIPDLVCGAPYVDPRLPGRPGRVYVLSGRDGTVIHEQLPSPDGPSNATLLGYTIVSMPAQAGSPFPLYVVAEPGFVDANYQSIGRIYCVRASPPGVTGFGSGCPGTLATTPRVGMRNFGSQGVRVHLSNAPPGAPALLLLGLSSTQLGPLPLPLALTSYGFPGCQLLSSADVALPVTTGVQGTSAGYAFCDIALPLGGSGPRTFAVYGQWLCLGQGATWPGGVSAALAWRN